MWKRREFLVFDCVGKYWNKITHYVCSIDIIDNKIELLPVM